MHYLDLVFVLTHKEMKVRYKHTVLGYLWSLANPLAFAFIFYVVFKVLARIPIENYPLFLIVGLFPWQWFANSINVSPSIFLGNAAIVQKIRFPRSVIPLAVVLQDALHFLLSIPVIVLFLLIYRQSVSWSWVYGIPCLLLIQLMLTYGIALLIATVNIFFRDMERLAALLVTFAFYFTPVLYSEAMIPEKYRSLICCHPLAPLMISWRNLFLTGEMRLLYVGVSFAYAAGFLLLGYTVYRRLSWKFAEVL